MGFDDILILAKLGPGYDEWGDTVDGGLDVHGVVVGVVCGDGVVFAVFAAGAEEEKEEDGDVASVGCRRSGSASSSNEGSTQKLEV